MILFFTGLSRHPTVREDPMSRRSIGLGLLAFAALLISGYVLGLVVPLRGVMTVPTWCCLAFALIGGALSGRRHDKNKVIHDLLDQIRVQIITHLQNGYDILAPSDHSGRTSRLSLEHDADGTVYIQERPLLGGAHRRYSITDTYILRRTLIACGSRAFTDEDIAWCDAPTTPARLRGVLKALVDEELYVPRTTCVRP